MTKDSSRSVGNFGRFSVALFAMFTALASLAGCSPENYYCDQRSCYYCDGVGCRTVTPPTRAACQNGCQCPTGQTCTASGCATPCTRDQDCLAGWICPRSVSDAGVVEPLLCRAPSEAALRVRGCMCTTASDCPTAGSTCVNGSCVAPSSSCANDQGCTGGTVCVAGRCVAPSSVCQFSNQCGAGRICVNSECRVACSASVSCPTGQECFQSAAGAYCRNRTTTACTMDSQCAGTQRCVNGQCYEACTPPSGTCPSADLYCADVGVCLPDTRPRPFCPNTTCAAGSSCVNGLCRAPCATNLECMMRDVTYRNCGRIPNQPSITATYCLTDNESTFMCTRQLDCAMGQNCVDGQCR